MKPSSARGAILVLISLSFYLHSVVSAPTSIALVTFPTVIHALAPAISVTVDIPNTFTKSQAIVVADLISFSELKAGNYKYQVPLARGIASAEAEAVIVPLAAELLREAANPLLIHAWIDSVDSQAIQGKETVSVTDLNKLSPPLPLISNEIRQVYAEEEKICVRNDYVGFLLPQKNFGPSQFDNVHDLTPQGINLFRLSLPKDPSTVAHSVLNVKSLQSFADSLNTVVIVDLPLTFQGMIDAVLNDHNVMYLVNSLPGQDTVAALFSLSLALNNSKKAVLLPSEMAFKNPWRFPNVIAHTEIKITKIANGECIAEPLNVGEIKALTQKLKDKKLNGIVSKLSVESGSCGNKTRELLDHLNQNSDTWLGWVWATERAYQVAPEYSTCPVDTKANIVGMIFGEDNARNKTKLYVLIAAVVVVAGVIMILTGFTLWLHMRRAEQKNRRKSDAVTTMKSQLGEPKTGAKHGRYEQPIRITFSDHPTPNTTGKPVRL